MDTQTQRTLDLLREEWTAPYREALDDLLNWAENIEGEGRLRRTEALAKARSVLNNVDNA